MCVALEEPRGQPISIVMTLLSYPESHKKTHTHPKKNPKHPKQEMSARLTTTSKFQSKLHCSKNMMRIYTASSFSPSQTHERSRGTHLQQPQHSLEEANNKHTQIHITDVAFQSHHGE